MPFDPKKRTKPRYFYGWNIVATSFLARLAYAEHFTSILGLFIKPLQREFGWGRSSIAGIQTTARVIEAAIAPVVGPLVDRYGPRLLMPVGALIVGAAMLGVTRITTLWQFYMLRGVIVAFGFMLMGGLVVDVAINNWFNRKRGRAIAISRVGGSLGNLIMAPSCVFIIANAGWRTMFVVFASVTWLTVLIPSMIFMRRRPEDIGLLPDGDIRTLTRNNGLNQESKSEESTSMLEPIWTRREVLATRTFWFIAVSYAINSLSFQGINISLAPYIQDLGYSNAMLAVLLTFRSGIMIPAGLTMGFISEKAQKPLMRAVPFMILSFGAIFFCLANTPVFLWLAIAAYALGGAGANVTQEVLWANYYGRLSLGLVRSTAYFISFGFGSIGPIAMNIIFDALRSYKPAFFLISGLFIIAAALIGLTRPVQAKRYAHAHEKTASLN